MQPFDGWASSKWVTAGLARFYHETPLVRVGKSCPPGDPPRGIPPQRRDPLLYPPSLVRARDDPAPHPLDGGDCHCGAPRLLP
jgi:hypothetical protein